MSPTIADLEAVASDLPAHRSTAPRRVDFTLISRLLGVGLPSDFQELSRTYPTLEFDNFLRVATPEPGRESHYVEGVRYELEILQDLVEEDMADGYVGFPEVNGLIPWGDTFDGDVFHWRVSTDDPDEWPVVVHTRNQDWWEFEGGIIAFLVGLINGSVERIGLPPNVPGPNPVIRVYGR